MIGKFIPATVGLLCGGITCAPVFAAPFSYLGPGFTQELVVSSATNVAGVTLGLDGYLYTNGSGGSGIVKWDPSNRTTVNGSSLYSQVATAAGSQANGWGITVDSAGNIFSLGSNQLYQVNTTTLAGTSVGAAGTYGLAYSKGTDSFVSSSGNGILETKKDGTVRTIASSSDFIDQVGVSPDGKYVAGAHCCSSSTGSVHIWDFTTGALAFHFDLAPDHAPDGLAFDNDGNIYTNNTDGTITRLEFANGGFAGGITGQTLIASGGCYGDLAGVGADGAFYVSQYCTKFDNGVNGSQSSIVRITKNPGSFVDGGTGGINNPLPVAEPATLLLFAGGLFGLAATRRRARLS